MLKPSLLRRTPETVPQFEVEPEPAPGDRILILVPHCDDETLGTGGLIWSARQQGVPVKIVFMTNGDGSRSTQLAENAKKLRRTTFLQLARMRQEEALAACAQLGVGAEDVVFMGYPDRGTGRMWFDHWAPGRLFRSPYTRADRAPYDNAHTPLTAYCGHNAWQDVRDLVAGFHPTRIYTTHPADTHTDHWACWAYALSALESIRADRRERTWADSTRLLTFLVHRGIWPLPHGYWPAARLIPPVELQRRNGTTRHWSSRELNAAASAAKKSALEQYVSQMAFTPHYLRGFLRRNELFEHIPTVVPPLAGPPTCGASAPETAIPADSTARGVFLTRIDRQQIILRLRLRQRRAPRRQIRLHLHVFGIGTTRAWSVEIRETGKSQQITARDAESGRTEEWGLQRSEAGLDLIIPRSAIELTVGAPQVPGLASAPRGSSKETTEAPNVTLLVGAAAHVGLTTLDRTEIGAVRIPGQISGDNSKNGTFTGEILIAPSDPRHQKRSARRQNSKRDRRREAV
jgi:LmbE family N-acetylglucosaminyl deacetylase